MMDNNIYEKILNILQEIRPDINFTSSEGLISNEILDSFDVITIISLIMEEFLIKIDVDDITPEYFDSVTNIVTLVQKNINHG
ncbi:acyl carrier protein [Lysinibacillus sp. FSL H8-0500]